MREVDRILFVDVERGNLDRGWSPDDVARELAIHDVMHDYAYLSNPADIEKFTHENDRWLCWPLDYSVGKNSSAISLFEALDYYHFPYIGCGLGGVSNTSKLIFKQSLRAAGISTPSSCFLSSWRDGAPLELPAYVKTEYTCASAGVRRVTTHEELIDAVIELEDRFEQTVFIEAEAPGEEWTIGCIVVSGRVIAAVLRLEPLRAIYIDSFAKSHNDAVRFTTADNGVMKSLARYATQISSRLRLSGYFRIDVVGNLSVGFQVIDLNILPCLNSGPAELSWLPMAFMRMISCSYSDVIGAVIASATEPANLRFTPGSALDYYAGQSTLLTRTGKGS